MNLSWFKVASKKGLNVHESVRCIKPGPWQYRLVIRVLVIQLFCSRFRDCLGSRSMRERSKVLERAFHCDRRAPTTLRHWSKAHFAEEHQRYILCSRAPSAYVRNWWAFAINRHCHHCSDVRDPDPTRNGFVDFRRSYFILLLWKMWSFSLDCFVYLYSNFLV